MSTSRSVTSRSVAETLRIAERLGRSFSGGEVVALTGPLGAGKTVFAKGVALGLDIAERDVTSPTFLLIHEIEGRLPFRHVDAYRAGGSAELAEVGADELLGDGSTSGEPVVVVEWADRVRDLLPADRLDVEMEHAGETMRRIALVATGPRHAELLEWLAGEEDR